LIATNLLNVLLNDPWGNVSVSDTASCRPNNTSIL